MILNIVNWCNENQGFLTILLSITTIIISIIAIIVSIKSARLPYKKKVMLSATFNYIVKGNVENLPYQLELVLTNAGNRSLYIHTLALGFFIDRELLQIYTLDDTPFEPQTVNSSELVTFKYTFIPVLNCIKENVNTGKLLPTSYIYIFCRDSEGKTYKKKFKTVEKLSNELPNQ